MYLIEVIPISRGIGKDTFSYFSAGAIAEGSLVEVPLRKRTVSALVISCRDAREAKSEIRTSEYVMKKVIEFKSENFLSGEFMSASRACAKFFAASLGSVLSLLVPKAILEGQGFPSRNDSLSASDDVFDRLALQAEETERFANYRSLVREAFARKRSVFICVPTAEDVKRLTPELAKGIEDYTYSLYASLPKRKMREIWSATVTSDHPVLIVATGLFFSACRSDIGVVILENESSRSYKLGFRPYLDVRIFAEFFAKEMKAKFIIGDLFLRTESIFRFKQGEFAEFSPLKFRSLSPVAGSVVDMSNYKKSAGGKFETVSAELSALIARSVASNQHLFILAVRRGLATQSVCGDCGEIVLCGRCNSPTTLHAACERGSGIFFLCHRCGEKRNAEERCAKCQSWKVWPLGIGIELVEQELRRKFPTLKISRIDKDKTPTAKKAALVVANFYASPGSLLLGTEMALSHIDRKIDNMVVASLDSLFALPDFRIHERILHLLLRIRSLALSSFLVQTRVPNEKVLEYVLKGNLIDFYRDEIAGRELFRYPPFTALIKISLGGTRAPVTREMEKLNSLFAPTNLEIFPAFVSESRGVFTMHALLRLPRGSWPNSELLQKLLSLPPQFRVEVEPESLL
ncbi:MAG: Primosomal protein N' [Candidatus Magasanikbacteria bacterium GW2011_GWA2_46_17]|uniref:Primosomal protein N n=1 Tax=Candidatus Magasanikbacteria bacterium GW2011_GWA2_46_17 TaxID=1619042 RepID=A0A0G1R774_9BACT|nr:MAG: Primosomal protein N' [Candidatus Magasanikbacteria bacterium GW2011_GWA2_46_17]